MQYARLKATLLMMAWGMSLSAQADHITRGCGKNKQWCALVTSCVTAGSAVIKGDARIGGQFNVGGNGFVGGTLMVDGALLGADGQPLLAEGPEGPPGPQGPAGEGIGFAFGYIYNLGTQTVALEQPIVFDSDADLVGIIHTGAGIQVPNTGVYAITFVVSPNAADSQFAFFVNGAFDPLVTPATIYGASASLQNVGFAVVNLSENDVITMVNHTSSSGAITLTTPIGGTEATVNASIAIAQLA